MTGKQKVIVLPQQCVVYKSGRPEVFVVTNGTVKAQSVKVELTDTNQVYITDGLKPGVTIAAKGANYLFNNSKVAIKQ